MTGDLNARFAAFHAANPQVYERLRALALEAKRHGARRIGIRMLWERLRWDLTLETGGAEPYKLNDHLTARYARLLMREPELAGLFELRGEVAESAATRNVAPATRDVAPARVDAAGQLAMW